MSILSENLKELKEPNKKQSNFRLWLDSLSEDDQAAALEAIHDTTIKKFPLFEALRKSGMKISKDTFFSIRERLQDGSLKDEDI